MNVQEAIEKRYSCRYYIPNRSLKDEDLALILNAGMRAPSGLGLEPWKFVVLTGDMSKLLEATNGQAHVQDASAVIALVNYKNELIEDDPSAFTSKFERSGFDLEKQQRYVDYAKIKGTQYYREQLMFAASQMTLQATELGLGTVVIGGFLPDKMGEILELNPRHYEVGLMLSIGYPAKEEVPQRLNRPIDEVVSYHKL